MSERNESSGVTSTVTRSADQVSFIRRLLGENPELETDKLSPETIEKVLSLSRYWSGPLPPPGALEEYEKAMPGLPERLVSTWQKEVEHRQGLERSASTLEKRGQVLAFITALAGLAAGTYLAATGHGIAGTATLISAIAALAGLFIYDRRARPGKGSEPESDEDDETD